MEEFAAVLNRWGPWIFIVCGVLTFCISYFQYRWLKKIRNDLVDRESKLPPAYRDMVRSKFNEWPPLPVDIPRQDIIWSMVQVVAGLAWLGLK